MSDYAELIERLRAHGRYSHPDEPLEHQWIPDPDCIEAADALTRLIAVPADRAKQTLSNDLIGLIMSAPGNRFKWTNSIGEDINAIVRAILADKGFPDPPISVEDPQGWRFEQPVANYIASDGRRWYWNAPTGSWVERPAPSPEPATAGEDEIVKFEAHIAATKAARRDRAMFSLTGMQAVLNALRAAERERDAWGKRLAEAENCIETMEKELATAERERDELIKACGENLPPGS